MANVELTGRRILLGVSGGIAAYKSVELARELTRRGAQVRVVMTASAEQFVAPLSLQAVTGREVRRSLFDTTAEAAMGHIELARWAELVLIAPATADLLARLAHGLADDLLSTLCLASAAPLLLAPAMNQQMWRHPATVANVALLMQRGVRLLGPDVGEQACGDVGPGRMLEAVALADATTAFFTGGQPLTGARAVVSAGPTREAIDPVRFIGNRSSGRMGYAVAEALAAQGADVTLVSGPVALPCPAGVDRIMVESAAQMHETVLKAVDGAALFVACAAVADYRPVNPAGHKMKKHDKHLQLELVRNPDILADVAARPNPPFCVGFAAETENLADHAEHKRRAKALQMIAANQVGEGLGFDTDENALLVLWEGGSKRLPRQPKPQLAQRLVQLIIERMHAQTAVENT